MTPTPASSPAPSSPTATVATPHSATGTTAMSAATPRMAAHIASERLRALTRCAVAPTAALQPTFSTSVPQPHTRPPSAPGATAHARCVPPAASAPLQARPVPSCAQQAPSLPLSGRQPAIPAPRERTLQVSGRSHAAAAPPECTVLQAHRSSAAAPSTRLRPLLVVPAPARPALGKLYPPRGRVSA